MPNIELLTLDPLKCLLSVGGQPIVGSVPGSKLKVSMASPAVSVFNDAEGGGQFVESAIKNGTVSVTLGAHSPSNLLLQSFQDAREAVPIMYKNLNSLTSFFTAAARIEKSPDLDGDGTNVVSNEWVFVFISGTIRHGGALPK